MLQERQTSELRQVSQSGACDSYAVLDECPEAASVNARWSKIWDAWETCK